MVSIPKHRFNLIITPRLENRRSNVYEKRKKIFEGKLKTEKPIFSEEMEKLTDLMLKAGLDLIEIMASGKDDFLWREPIDLDEVNGNVKSMEKMFADYKQISWFDFKTGKNGKNGEIFINFYKMAEYVIFSYVLRNFHQGDEIAVMSYQKRRKLVKKYLARYPEKFPFAEEAGKYLKIKWLNESSPF